MERPIRSILVICVLTLTLTMLGCSSGTGGTTGSGGTGTGDTSTGGEGTTSATTVTMQDFAFSPASVTVKVGDTVTWDNKDSTGHTVTADDGTWESPSIPQGGKYSKKFETAGTFAYHCSIHPSMTGTVIVQ